MSGILPTELEALWPSARLIRGARPEDGSDWIEKVYEGVLSSRMVCVWVTPIPGRGDGGVKSLSLNEVALTLTLTLTLTLIGGVKSLSLNEVATREVLKAAMRYDKKDRTHDLLHGGLLTLNLKP